MLPGLSLFTLVLICIFATWLMGACDICLSCSDFMGDKSLIRPPKSVKDSRYIIFFLVCFTEELTLLGIVHIGVLDPMCVFV